MRRTILTPTAALMIINRHGDHRQGAQERCSRRVAGFDEVDSTDGKGGTACSKAKFGDELNLRAPES
ncbi:hypothetical protein G5S37_11660 [Roseimicrobium sp. ORNL1]|nr:hypothetical protein G5S37_11660 [Roseimicrobium sp. ORNL1]